MCFSPSLCVSLSLSICPLSSIVVGANDIWACKFQLADKLPERYEGQRKTKTNRAVGNLAFPYSLYFVFYEQYAFIQVCMQMRYGLLTRARPWSMMVFQHSRPSPAFVTRRPVNLELHGCASCVAGIVVFLFVLFTRVIYIPNSDLVNIWG